MIMRSHHHTFRQLENLKSVVWIRHCFPLNFRSHSLWKRRSRRLWLVQLAEFSYSSWPIHLRLPCVLSTIVDLFAFAMSLRSQSSTVILNKVVPSNFCSMRHMFQSWPYHQFSQSGTHITLAPVPPWQVLVKRMPVNHFSNGSSDLAYPAETSRFISILFWRVCHGRNNWPRHTVHHHRILHKSGSPIRSTR
jgi:hypothetical protein